MPVFDSHGMEVNRPAWVRARIGHLTASRMGAVLDVRKDGKPGADRVKYLKDLVAERMTDSAMNHYVTEAMQHGLDYEDEAKAVYASKTNQKLATAEFVIHPHIPYFGATPDALIGQDGLAEFKCPTTQKFIEWRRENVVPAEHIPQMLAQLACTGREWCDLVAYDPRIKFGPRIAWWRFTPTSAQIRDVEAAARDFLAEVDALFDLVTREAA